MLPWGRSKPLSRYMGVSVCPSVCFWVGPPLVFPCGFLLKPPKRANISNGAWPNDRQKNKGDLVTSGQENLHSPESPFSSFGSVFRVRPPEKNGKRIVFGIPRKNARLSFWFPFKTYLGLGPRKTARVFPLVSRKRRRTTHTHTTFFQGIPQQSDEPAV